MEFTQSGVVSIAQSPHQWHIVVDMSSRGEILPIPGRARGLRHLRLPPAHDSSRTPCLPTVWVGRGDCPFDQRVSVFVEVWRVSSDRRKALNEDRRIRREQTNIMKRPLAALAASLLMIGAAAITAPAATADTIDRTQSCWRLLDTGKSLCVDADANLADAVYEAYGIVLSTPDGALEVSDELVNDSSSARSDVAPLASTVIGIFYEHNNYGGASYAASVTQNGCYGYAHGYTSLAGIGWDNRITSFRSYSNCKTAIFENTNYGGASYGYYVNSSNVGAAMNDRASSIRWAA